MTVDTDCSRLYPWHIRMQLVEAARRHNVHLIDALTDQLVHMGLARPRNDASVFSSVARIDTASPRTSVIGQSGPVGAVAHRGG